MILLFDLISMAQQAADNATVSSVISFPFFAHNATIEDL
jgi:hypothetical protein